MDTITCNGQIFLDDSWEDVPSVIIFAAMPRLLMCCCSTIVCSITLYTLICIILFYALFQSPLPLPQWDAKDAHFFGPSCSNSTQDDCPTEKFFFGLATAPAHVEDNLNDSWLDFALQSNKVRAWHNVPYPEQRLRFWSEPDVELSLAKEAGATVFRLGIDWGRIVTSEPINGTSQVADEKAVEHYKWILQRVHDHGMQVMLTLFHHSMPKWALYYGGWTDDRTANYFIDFARYAKAQFGSYVDYWVTFNEPHIFLTLSYCSGVWPPGRELSPMESILCFAPFRVGYFSKAMDIIGRAHIGAYRMLHQGSPDAIVGVAHHVGVVKPYGLFDIPIALFSRQFMLFSWIDYIKDHLDFCGLNYYGQEILSAAGLMLVKDEEYSEAGRSVYPNGLYELLIAFHKRYNVDKPSLRYIITENGFSDGRDILRRPYLLEHLLAIHAAKGQGVPVDGYLHWTIADNWEWTDGYCPKFGLVDVDRTVNLKRHPRPSYHLYKQIATTGVVTAEQREKEWATLQGDIKKGGIRFFCRATDRFNRMFATGLDTPIMRPIVDRDWRFGKYKAHGISTYICRTIEVAKILFYDTLFCFTGSREVNVPLDIVRGEL